MDGSDTSASQHCKCSFNDHRHVDKYPIARLDLEPVLQHASQFSDLLLDHLVGPSHLLPGIDAVLKECNVAAVSVEYVPVDSIEADVDLAIREPSVKILVALINYLAVQLVPVDALCLHVKES